MFKTPEPGFEPGSEPRQGSMIGLYTIRTFEGGRFEHPIKDVFVYIAYPDFTGPASQTRTGDIAVPARNVIMSHESNYSRALYH